MEAAFAVILLFAAIMVGRAMVVAKTPTIQRIAIYIGIYLLSILIQCMRYFGPTWSTWYITYESGLVLGAIPSLLLHVLPAAIAYHTVKIMRNQNSASR